MRHVIGWYRRGSGTKAVVMEKDMWVEQKPEGWSSQCTVTFLQNFPDMSSSVFNVFIIRKLSFPCN